MRFPFSPGGGRLYSGGAIGYGVAVKTPLPQDSRPAADAHGRVAPDDRARIDVTVCGRRWELLRAANLEELWEAMTEDPRNFEDERLPYWTELWPSSLVLAQWLECRQAEIAGRICLDLGCGLGLTALVGSLLGARVLGLDYEAEALHFAARNAAHNGLAPGPLWAVMDWRRPAVRPGAAARIWGGDIMYEKRFVAPVMRFLEHALSPDGVAWLAEPGRNVYEAFLQALHGGGWQGRRVFGAEVAPLYAQPVPVTVHVWEISRRATALRPAGEAGR